MNGALNMGLKTISGSGIFTLSDGATLGIGSPLGITASGTNGNIITANRNFSSAANYHYNGSTSQVTGNGLIGANNLIISNPAGVSINNPVSVKGLLSFGNVNGSTITTNGNLTLKSQTDASARVADLTNNGLNSGNAILGNITVERFIPTAKRAWRLLTPSVSGGTINLGWQEGAVQNENPKSGFGTLITGGSAYANAEAAAVDGFDFINTGGTPSIRTYTPGTTTGHWNATITPKSGFGYAQAYMLFVRGDRSVTTGTPTTTTLRATGGYKSDANVAIDPAQSHTLVGNPYPSPIDFEAIYQSNSTKVKRLFWIWDATAGTFGAYKLINYESGNNTQAIYQAIPAPFNSTGADLKTIQSGQGFFVEPTMTGGNLNIIEAHKTSATVATPIFRVGNGSNERLRVNLYQLNSDGTSNIADGIQARYDNNYTDADNIGKISNFNENLAIAYNGKDVIVQSKKLMDNGDTIFLRLWNTTTRNYQFQFKADNFSHTSLTAFLEDKYLNTSALIDLKEAITTINFSITTDVASADPNRFRIVFKVLETLPVSISSINAYEKGRGVSVEWNTYAEINVKAYEVENRLTDGTLP